MAQRRQETTESARSGGGNSMEEEEEVQDSSSYVSEFLVLVSAFEDDLDRLEEAFGGGGGSDTAKATWAIGALTLVDDSERSHEYSLHSEDELRELRRSFGRFVTVLSHNGRRGVRSLHFSTVDLDEVDWFDSDDSTRLFADVLPALLPSLERLTFDECTLPTDYLSSFLTKLSLTTSDTCSLSELAFNDCGMDPTECAPLLAQVLRRSVVPIHTLTLNPMRRVGRDSCREIFRSVVHSWTLQSLTLRLDEVYDDALVLPSCPLSGLRSLRLDVERWTESGRSYLARHLRTNTSLEELHIYTTPTVSTYFNGHCVLSMRPGASYCYSPWIELLERYNCTLRSLAETYVFGIEDMPSTMTVERISACLRRNVRIHEMLDRHRRGSGGYQVSPMGLLPRTLGLVSNLPTLVYRFLRRGDLSTIGNLLLLARRQPPPPQQQQQSATSGAKRKRGLDSN
jgi:hypothetical protein